MRMKALQRYSLLSGQKSSRGLVNLALASTSPDNTRIYRLSHHREPSEELSDYVKRSLELIKKHLAPNCYYIFVDKAYLKQSGYVNDASQTFKHN